MKGRVHNSLHLPAVCMCEHAHHQLSSCPYQNHTSTCTLAFTPSISLQAGQCGKQHRQLRMLLLVTTESPTGRLRTSSSSAAGAATVQMPRLLSLTLLQPQLSAQSAEKPSAMAWSGESAEAPQLGHSLPPDCQCLKLEPLC